MFNTLKFRVGIIGLAVTAVSCVVDSAGADESTIARFRREYPEAGRRIEDVYSHIAIGSRCRYFDAGTFRSENRFHFIRDGSRFRLEQEMLTKGTNPFGTRYSFLLNHSYFFSIRRPDLASRTKLISAKSAPNSPEKALVVCFEAMEPPPVNLYGFHLASNWSYTFLTMFDWNLLASGSEIPEIPKPATLVDAETTHDGDKELVKLKCKTIFDQEAEFTLSPSDQCVVIGYRLEWPESQMLSGTHEFEGTHQGVPLIKSCEYFFKLRFSGEEGFRNTSLKADVLFIDPGREFPEGIFEPDELGVHFSPPIAPDETPTWRKWPLLVLLGSLIILMVAIWIRRIAGHSTASS